MVADPIERADEEAQTAYLAYVLFSSSTWGLLTLRQCRCACLPSGS